MRSRSFGQIAAFAGCVTQQDADAADSLKPPGKHIGQQLFPNQVGVVRTILQIQALIDGMPVAQKNAPGDVELEVGLRISELKQTPLPKTSTEYLIMAFKNHPRLWTYAIEVFAGVGPVIPLVFLATRKSSIVVVFENIDVVNSTVWAFSMTALLCAICDLYGIVRHDEARRNEWRGIVAILGLIAILSLILMSQMYDDSRSVVQPFLVQALVLCLYLSVLITNVWMMRLFAISPIQERHEIG